MSTNTQSGNCKINEIFCIDNGSSYLAVFENGGIGGDDGIPPVWYLTGVIQASANASYALALLNNGRVTGWGDNSYGQVTGGNSLTGVVQVSAGGEFCLALLNNGQVTGWGDNSRGAAAGGNSLTGVAQVSAGYYHGLALLNNGRVTGWGDNYYGQATAGNSLTGVAQVSAGGEFGLALLNNGRVTGWGDNFYGEATRGNSLTGVAQVSAGGYFSLALLNDGRVTGWGQDDYGQANGGNELTGVKLINAGPYSSIAVLSDDSVTGWGDNNLYYPPMKACPGPGQLYFSGIEGGNSIQAEYDGNQHSISYQLLDMNNIEQGNLSDSPYFVNTTEPSVILNTAPILPGYYIQYFNITGINGIYSAISGYYPPLTGETTKGSINIINSYAKEVQIVINSLTNEYNEQPNPINVLTYPVPNISLNITYNGLTGIPTATGIYNFKITCSDPNYYAKPVTGIYSIVGSFENKTYALSWGDNTSNIVTFPSYNNGSGLVNVQKIACGNDFCIALMNDNSTVTWGTGNLYGQQNIPYINNYIKDITTSNTTTFIIDWNGNVTGCGYLFNTLGNGYTGNVFNLTGIKSISAADYYMVAIPENPNSNLIGWGNIYESFYNYRHAYNLTNIDAISCTNFSFIALQNSVASGYGVDFYGQLSWMSGNNTGIKKISCSDSITTFLYNDKTFTGYGMLRDSDTGLYPFYIPDQSVQGKVLDIAVSSGHVLLTTSQYVAPLPPPPPDCTGVTYA